MSATPAHQEVSLTQMHIGCVATIHRVGGGAALAHRLESMGLRPGKRVRKVSSMFLGGPTTVQVEGGPQIALGRGLAGHVFVKVER